SEKTELRLTQPLTSAAITALAGETYTLGGWAWASVPVEIRLPTLFIGDEMRFQTMEITQTPTFFAITGTMPASAQYVQMVLDPLADPLEYPISLYFDDLILAPGEYALDRKPNLTPEGTSGTWGSKDFINWVRNASAEKNWLTFRPSVLFKFQSQANIPIYALPAIQDLRLTQNFYRQSGQNLFESYWARFGWNHVGLPPAFYVGLAWITGFSVFATGGVFLRMYKQLNLPLILWLVGCAALFWVAALVRQSLPYWDTIVFTPSARYAYPAIIPTTMALSAGWYGIYHAVGKKNRVREISFLPIAFLLILDITSLIVVYRFYYLGL
ncbi:MAG: hypothetical protein HUU38_31410, partial [Anaerolineales bacterium]|nr:hypothetical protein [Anaerolineales bacterium]